MSPWLEYARFPITLFVILTPIAAIPVYMSLTSGQNRSVRARIAWIAVDRLRRAGVRGRCGQCRAAPLRVQSRRLARGWWDRAPTDRPGEAVWLSGPPRSRGATGTASRAEIGVVPLGIPLLAGPGAISTVIIHVQQGRG